MSMESLHLTYTIGPFLSAIFCSDKLFRRYSPLKVPAHFLSFWLTEFKMVDWAQNNLETKILRENG